MNVVRFIFNAYRVCTYVLIDEDKSCVIIDAANDGPKETARLTDFIREKGLRPIALLNTHCHVDHILGVKDLMDEYHIPFYASPLEIDNVKWSESVAPMMGFQLKMPPLPEALSEEFVFGSSRLKVLPCPGHTLGGLSFYAPEEGIVFTGDTLFAGSIGRSDLPGGNLDDLMKSIKEQLLTLPSETSVYPGHGPDSCLRDEINSNPFLGQADDFTQISL